MLQITSGCSKMTLLFLCLAPAPLHTGHTKQLQCTMKYWSIVAEISHTQSLVGPTLVPVGLK